MPSWALLLQSHNLFTHLQSWCLKFLTDWFLLSPEYKGRGNSPITWLTWFTWWLHVAASHCCPLITDHTKTGLEPLFLLNHATLWGIHNSWTLLAYLHQSQTHLAYMHLKHCYIISSFFSHLVISSGLQSSSYLQLSSVVHCSFLVPVFHLNLEEYLIS